MWDTGYRTFKGVKRGKSFLAAAGALALLTLTWGWPKPATSQSAGSLSVSPAEIYANEIRPLLEQRCLGCHQGSTAQSNLDLSTREGALRGGDRGPAIVPGNPQESLLYKALAHQTEPAMPPGGKSARLPEHLLARIAKWIETGASYGDQAGVLSGNGGAAETVAEASGNDFEKHVRPLLETKCIHCHGANGFKRAGLDLTTREGLLAGGDSGAAAVPGQAGESLLLKQLRHEVEPGMPFETDKLSDEEIERIAAWIAGGATYPSEPLRLSDNAPAAVDPRLSHWAFQPPVRPKEPKVQNATWVRNSIDSFIAAEHERKGLEPLAEADKRTLLRRVYIDLIGLPPTVAEMDAFLDDTGKDAYEKVVDRLLQDPRYGERWGRHWMDVWRYSDPEGYGGRVDYSQKHIWQWRDWIIESLNKDKGYDRMVMEMLAGDEIAPTDPEALRATGYLARSWYRFSRHSWLQDTVDHTATAFLGVSLRCARCHEHKYDPIQQEEYYRFRAFFEPYDIRTDHVPGAPDTAKNGLPRAYEAEPREALPDEANPGVLLPAIFGETRRFIRGDENSPDEKVLQPGVPAALGGGPLEIAGVELPVLASYPALRPFVQEDMLAAAKDAIGRAEADLDRAKRTLAHARKRAAEAVEPAEASKTAVARADPPPTNAKEPLVFEKDIRPIFEKRCFSCHNAQTTQSGLSLDTTESVLAGGNRNGPAVIGRNALVSPLMLYIRGEKTPRMPVGGDPLTEEQIALIETWINQLPEEDPQLALRRAEESVRATEKDLEAARANLPALVARIAADRAKFQPEPGVDADAFAETARRAERQAHLLRAEARLLWAQQKLSEALSRPAPEDAQGDKDREKQISVARREVDTALKALGQSTQSYTHVGQAYPSQSSGRRSALARWIVDPRNPLAARVAINHMWLRHFGQALVPTVENFGLSGQPPINQALLDWLALELIDRGWSMKSMHRLMVTSSTYRMKSAADTEHPNRQIDPDNRLLWRMNTRRLEAEAVRDSVLYVAGQLEPSVGGPDEQDIDSHRRGMYFKQTPYSQMIFLRLFDAADPDGCYERSESVIPQQALALANSPLSLEASRALARQLSETRRDASTFVAAAFETVLGRPASEREAGLARDFLVRQAALFRDPSNLTAFGMEDRDGAGASKDPDVRARENLVHVLLNHNDFVTAR